MKSVLRGLVFLLAVTQSAPWSHTLTSNGGCVSTARSARHLRAARSQPRPLFHPASIRMQGRGSMDAERRRLENLYRTSFGGRTDAAAAGAGRLKQLPLWSASSAASQRRSDGGQMMLPGVQTILTVQEPRHCRMFEELVARDGPRLFGAVVCDGGKAELELPGAPGHVGTLMEVVSCRRLPGSEARLLLHVIGVCRVRLDSCQTVPCALGLSADNAAATDHMQGDFVVLPDEEEIQFMLPTGTGQVMAKIRKLEALSQDILATLEDGYFQRASELVAKHAAAAWSLTWREYEASVQVAATSSTVLDDRSPFEDLAAACWAGTADSSRVAGILALDLAADPTDAFYSAQSAASATAKRHTPEALRLVGYKPMMREYLDGGGVLGAGLTGGADEELMPPSWLDVMDHFDRRQAGEGSQTGERGEVDQEDETDEVAQQVEVREGWVGGVGGKWGGQVHGRGGGELKENLRKQEISVWSSLQVPSCYSWRAPSQMCPRLPSLSNMCIFLCILFPASPYLVCFNRPQAFCCLCNNPCPLRNLLGCIKGLLCRQICFKCIRKSPILIGPRFVCVCVCMCVCVCVRERERERERERVGGCMLSFV